MRNVIRYSAIGAAADVNRTTRAKTPVHSNGAGRHRATDRVIDILELAASSPDGLLLKDLSARVETPKSSLLPLLRTLSARGYLEQARGGAYRLGSRALELAVRAPGRRDLTEAARPALDTLMRRTGESAFLATLAVDGGAVVFIDVVESDQIIRYTVNVGQRSPLHATSNGKAILAFLPPGERDAALRDVTLKRYTERTITTLAALHSALEEIRTSGVSVSIDELVKGASGIAAPVFGRDGRVAGACAVGGPTDRMKPRMRQLGAEVKTTARAISMTLGFDPDSQSRR
jgi:IclR family acetate operon transcriptional repressor